jgi:hypothetical protein
MQEVSKSSQIIGEFLDSSRYTLCQVDSSGHRYTPVTGSIEQILARYYDVDLVKVEQERRAILAKLTG